MAKKASKRTDDSEALVMAPGYSLVDPNTRQVVTATPGFRIRKDHPFYALQPHKFVTVAVARERGFPILTEDLEPAVQKDEPKPKAPAAPEKDAGEAFAGF